jgi:hypothetical protein
MVGRYPLLPLPDVLPSDDADQVSICFHRDYLPVLMALVERLGWSASWLDRPDEFDCEQVADDFALILANATEGCFMDCCNNIYNVTYNIRQYQIEQRITEIVNNYAGDVTNIHSSAPDVAFDSGTGDGTGDVDYRLVALCATVHDFVSQVLDEVMQQRIAAGVAITAASSLVAPLWGTFFGVLTATALIGFTDALFADADAKKAVICCMYQALRGTAPSPSNFAASLDACDFDALSNESQIAGVVALACQSEATYVRFMELLGERFEQYSYLGVTSNDCDDCPLPQVFDFDFENDGPFPDYWEMDDLQYEVTPTPSGIDHLPTVKDGHLNYIGPLIENISQIDIYAYADSWDVNFALPGGVMTEVVPNAEFRWTTVTPVDSDTIQLRYYKSWTSVQGRIKRIVLTTA